MRLSDCTPLATTVAAQKLLGSGQTRNERGNLLLMDRGSIPGGNSEVG